VAKKAEEETVGDVLTRVSALNKPEMTKEVESYGLEVHSSWTKEEIMEKFEQFLLEPEASDVEESADEPDVVNVTEMNVEQLNVGEPSTDVPPPSTTTYAEPPPVQPEGELPSNSGDVRIMESPSRRGGWGRTGGAYAP